MATLHPAVGSRNIFENWSRKDFLTVSSIKPFWSAVHSKDNMSKIPPGPKACLLQVTYPITPKHKSV
jgi:hypothetical protein